MPNATICEVSPSESEEARNRVVTAFLELFNDPGVLRFVRFTQIPFERGEVDAWIEEYSAEERRYFVAADPAGQILGLQMMDLDPDEGCDLTGCAVRPGARRQGIGRSLTDHAVRQARELGYIAVDSNVFADNVERLRLLLSMDFIPVGISHNARLDGTDLVQMRRYLVHREYKVAHR